MADLETLIKKLEERIKELSIFRCSNIHKAQRNQVQWILNDLKHLSPTTELCEDCGKHYRSCDCAVKQMMKDMPLDTKQATDGCDHKKIEKCKRCDDTGIYSTGEGTNSYCYCEIGQKMNKDYEESKKYKPVQIEMIEDFDSVSIKKKLEECIFCINYLLNQPPHDQTD